MLTKTRAIFLNYTKYSDSSIIVQVYTEAFGRMSYMVGGLKTRKTRGRINLFQALFLLDIEVYHKANSASLQRLKEASMAAPLGSLPFDVIKSSQAIFIAEFLQVVLREEEESPQLFAFLFSAVEILDTIEEGKANFLLSFLFKFSKQLGIEPRYPNSDALVYFDLMQGSFVSNEPTHHAFLDKSLSAAFLQFFNHDMSSVHLLRLSNAERRELLDALIQYYKIHLELNVEFKSLAVMRELMS